MIYIPQLSTAFCHVPRTSGIAICLAILEKFPDAVFDDGWNIHQPSWEIRRHYPGVDVFALMRNPWHIWESNYGWARRYDNETRPFDRYISEQIDENWPCWYPGFYATYLDDDVTVFRYECKPYGLISELLGVELELETHNETIHERPTWTDELVAMVRRQCIGDIDRYGYSFQD